MANVSSSNGIEKYPKLRFPQYSDSWDGIRFGDLIEEFSHRTKVEDEDILLSAAIEGMFLNTELFGHQRGASNKGYKKINYGTLVLSTQNLHLGNANVNLRFEHGMVSPAYKTYSIKNCSVKLLAEWIKSEKAKQFFYDATTVGASVCRRNVEWDTLYDQPLYLPDDNEQHHIAEFLSLISERIHKQEHFIECLKKYKRGLLQAVFSREIQLENSSNWEHRLFGEIASLGKGKYTPKQKEILPCIELEHLEQQTGQIIGYANSNEQNSVKSVFHKGDVLFGKLRPYLRKFALPEYDGVCSSEIWVLHPEANIDSAFLFYLIQSERFIAAANISSGTKMPRAEWSKVSSESFFIPELTEQKRIAELFGEIDKRIVNASRSVNEMQSLKQGLLQQLFI